MTERFVVIDEGAPSELTAEVRGDSVLVAPAELARGLGWELKPQGFCKDDLCYPAPAGNAVVTAGGVDLAAFAALIGRPLATDAAAGAAYLGASAASRAAGLASLQAPDFTLPDLKGRNHSLSDFRGRKVLLAAYGSW